jgi:hypothetical protein
VLLTVTTCYSIHLPQLIGSPEVSTRAKVAWFWTCVVTESWMAQLGTATPGVYVHMSSTCICYWEHCVWFSCWEYSLPGLVTFGSAVPALLSRCSLAVALCSGYELAVTLTPCVMFCFFVRWFYSRSSCTSPFQLTLTAWMGLSRVPLEFCMPERWHWKCCNTIRSEGKGGSYIAFYRIHRSISRPAKALR